MTRQSGALTAWKFYKWWVIPQSNGVGVIKGEREFRGKGSLGEFYVKWWDCLLTVRIEQSEGHIETTTTQRNARSKSLSSADRSVPVSCPVAALSLKWLTIMS